MEKLPKYYRWFYNYPPPKFIADLLKENEQLAVVGVIGKSSQEHCNKLRGFSMGYAAPFYRTRPPIQGDIEFIFSAEEKVLFVQFFTDYDSHLVGQVYRQREYEILKGYTKVESKSPADFFDFHNRSTKEFASLLQLALVSCHIVVFTEVGHQFDSSLLRMLCALQNVREQHLAKLLPKLLEANSPVNLGAQGRLCSPRLLFFFENYPRHLSRYKEPLTDWEFDIEDKIYKQLCEARICNNNNKNSLISVHGNKPFVFCNIDLSVTTDLMEKICEASHERSTDFYHSFCLGRTVDRRSDELIVKLKNPFDCLDPEKSAQMELEKHKFSKLLCSHIEDVFGECFYEYSGNSQTKYPFHLLPATQWIETFRKLHYILMDPDKMQTIMVHGKDYTAYLEYFDAAVAGDCAFLKDCCQQALEKSAAAYRQSVPPLYDQTKHEQAMETTKQLYNSLARGPQAHIYRTKLEEECLSYWQSGRQICGARSLRGNPCVRSRDAPHDNATHTSGEIFYSACNCGHVQGSREDPYTIQQANFEFYEFMVQGCKFCQKAKRISFKVAQPKTVLTSEPLEISQSSEVSSAGIKSQRDNSDGDNGEDYNDDDEYFNFTQPAEEVNFKDMSAAFKQLKSSDFWKYGAGSGSYSSDDDGPELSDNNFSYSAAEEENEKVVTKLVEPQLDYIVGLIHSASPRNLLPLFPSWSLLNIGSGCLYGHNTGLQEHFQRGFFSGLNYLLPWNVKVNLTVPGNASGGGGYARKRQTRTTVLKVFIGMEYECARGRRFIMNDPERVVKGAPDINQDMANRVIEGNMPLYFPCFCNVPSGTCVAQLMRVHVVTPKAPVNITVNPKVCCGKNSKNEPFEFTWGLKEPQALSPGCYWVLRLPYAYQGDNVVVNPSKTVTAKNAQQFGYLAAGIFGVTDELESSESLSALD